MYAQFYSQGNFKDVAINFAVPKSWRLTTSLKLYRDVCKRTCSVPLPPHDFLRDWPCLWRWNYDLRVCILLYGFGLSRFVAHCCWMRKYNFASKNVFVIATGIFSLWWWCLSSFVFGSKIFLHCIKNKDIEIAKILLEFLNII